MAQSVTEAAVLLFSHGRLSEKMMTLVKVPEGLLDHSCRIIRTSMTTMIAFKKLDAFVQ